MIFINKSKKVISIADKVLLPGEDATVADAMAKLPAVKVLIEKGLLAAIEEPAKAAPKAKAKTAKANNGNDDKTKDDEGKTPATGKTE